MATIKSIEEKAKRYNEALEKARQLCAYPTTKPFISDLKDIFPELAESEDDKTRSALLRGFNSMYANQAVPTFAGEPIKDILAWLEKQGMPAKYHDICDTCVRQPTCQSDCFLQQSEQKPTDKVEPKFKLGDWVVRYGETLQISGIDTLLDGTFHYWFTKGTWLSSKKMENARLWTIQDAKDGDVLCSESGWTCIFKALDNHTNTFSSYCFMDSYKWFCNTGSECHTLDKAFIKAYNGEIYPATKEQRNLLFQKMKEAGYEWDAEKKELKKIEQKPTVWSEEDEMRFNNIFTLLEGLPLSQNWLKNLKDRVFPQPKQEWSEEDDELYNDLSDTYFYNDEDYPEETYKLMLKRVLDWMTKRAKSLRPKSQWKLSKEQMDALKDVIENHVYDCRLEELLEQLKKLREE